MGTKWKVAGYLDSLGNFTPETTDVYLDYDGDIATMAREASSKYGGLTDKEAVIEDTTTGDRYIISEVEEVDPSTNQIVVKLDVYKVPASASESYVRVASVPANDTSGTTTA